MTCTSVIIVTVMFTTISEISPDLCYRIGIPVEHQLKGCELGGSLLLGADAVGHLLQERIPVVLLIVHQLREALFQGLVGPLIQTIGLWVVGTGNRLLNSKLLAHFIVHLQHTYMYSQYWHEIRAISFKRVHIATMYTHD